MLNLSTVKDTLKYFVQTYGPLFPATATAIAAIVAAFAARAAMRSARASERNVDTAKLSMELGNRAYVSVSSTKCQSPIALGAIPCASVSFKNVGKTIAKTCRLRLEFELKPTKFTQHIPETPLDDGEFTLAPGQEKTFLATNIPMEVQHIARIGNEELYLYFWGRLVYADVFGQEHTTTWCLYYSTATPTLLALHPYGNDMT